MLADTIDWFIARINLIFTAQNLNTTCAHKLWDYCWSFLVHEIWRLYCKVTDTPSDKSSVKLTMNLNAVSRSETKQVKSKFRSHSDVVFSHKLQDWRTVIGSSKRCGSAINIGSVRQQRSAALCRRLIVDQIGGIIVVSISLVLCIESPIESPTDNWRSD